MGLLVFVQYIMPYHVISIIDNDESKLLATLDLTFSMSLVSNTYLLPVISSKDDFAGICASLATFTLSPSLLVIVTVTSMFWVVKLQRVKPKTIEDLRAEAFGEYQSTGNTDKLLENLASIDSAEDLSREINNAEYAYEQAFFFGNEVGYYGIDSANAVEDLRASSGNENLVPLYNIGLEETFLENIPSDSAV